jgi:hypothetical protein
MCYLYWRRVASHCARALLLSLLGQVGRIKIGRSPCPVASKALILLVRIRERRRKELVRQEGGSESGYGTAFGVRVGFDSTVLIG